MTPLPKNPMEQEKSLLESMFQAQMPLSQEPQLRGFEGTGGGQLFSSLGGGQGIFDALGRRISQHVDQADVQPFVQEVREMAQDRFGFNGGISRAPHHFFGSRNEDFSQGMNPFLRAQQLQEAQAQFSTFANGGPVSAGLGSFLASNIDEFGRNGDTEVIHATKSEVVLPKGMVDNPEVRQTVRDLFEQTGRDMQEYTVGSGEMNVNPMTGYEEAFDLIGGIKDIFKKAAPVLLPIATSFLFSGMSPFLSGALAGGVGSLIQGGSVEDAFKSGIQGGLVSSAGALMTGTNPFKPVNPDATGMFDLRDDPIGDLGLGGKFEKAKGYFMNEGVAANPGVTIEQAIPEAQKIAAANPTLYNTPESIRNLATELVVKPTAAVPATINTGRAIAGGLGALALAGGFDEIEEDDMEDPYPYSSRELMEMYPERYRTGPLIAPRRRERVEEVRPMFAAKGGEMEFPRRQGYIAGPGTETSDDIPAMLSDGEFVMTARAVRGAGDGSRKNGVKKMYDIMRAFEGGVVS